MKEGVDDDVHVVVVLDVVQANVARDVCFVAEVELEWEDEKCTNGSGLVERRDESGLGSIETPQAVPHSELDLDSSRFITVLQ